MTGLTRTEKGILGMVLVIALAHLARDIMQNFGVHTFFTEFLHKDIGTDAQSYMIELTVITLVIAAFWKKQFRPAGLIASILLMTSLATWFVLYAVF